jgi:hypothetical protein
MLELSLHILDIAENSIRAGAKLLQIIVTEDSASDVLTIQLIDDGAGMTVEELERVLDPFYTTKKVRRFGLGLPMLSNAAGTTGGSFDISSKPNIGTTVTAVFQRSHIDRQPLGNITDTLITLIAGKPDMDFLYRHNVDGRNFEFDTRIIKKEIDDVPINHVDVLRFIRQHIEEGLEDIGAEHSLK